MLTKNLSNGENAKKNSEGSGGGVVVRVDVNEELKLL